eukprot:c13949_g2_i1.p1 GENE.c13949_g2_i1~~c13949_g2_i1.p1  ORF type:complete len:223 (+),score=40.53 c13949_g2_i1:1108-1776(+)
MTLVLLRTHKTSTTPFLATVSASLTDRIFAQFEEVLETGRSYNLEWELSEPLLPLLRLCTHKGSTHGEQINPNLARLATPQLTSLLVRTLEKGTDAWATEMALELLLALCDYHTLLHGTHNLTNCSNSCLLCAAIPSQPHPTCVDLQRHLGVEFDLHDILAGLKRAPPSAGVFEKSKKLLLRATADRGRWLSFCMAQHRRLGACSPAQNLPSDLLPRVLDFL